MGDKAYYNKNERVFSLQWQSTVLALEIKESWQYFKICHERSFPPENGTLGTSSSCYSPLLLFNIKKKPTVAAFCKINPTIRPAAHLVQSKLHVANCISMWQNKDVFSFKLNLKYKLYDKVILFPVIHNSFHLSKCLIQIFSSLTLKGYRQISGDQRLCKQRWAQIIKIDTHTNAGGASHCFL